MRWVALAPVVLILPGCFGGGGADESTARSRYVKQANAICHRWYARSAALGGVPARGDKRYARYDEQANAIAEKELARLNSLPVPKSLRPLHSEWRREMRRLSRQIAGVRRATVRLKADKRRASGAVIEQHSAELAVAERAELSTIFRILGLFKRMGLDQCAQAP